GAVDGFLEKGLAHFTAHHVDLDEIVETRLAPDMLPFRFQLQSVAHHSLGAIEGAKKGLFQPPPQAPAYDYRGLQQLVADAREALQKVTPAEVNALEGKDVVFQLRDFKMPFTAEGFLLSFSLPNFYFHATTAYDILRMKGVPIGKGDYRGQMRLRSCSARRGRRAPTREFSPSVAVLRVARHTQPSHVATQRCRAPREQRWLAIP